MDRRSFNAAAGAAAFFALSSVANACSPAPASRTESIADVLAALLAGRHEQARAMLDPQVRLIVVDPLNPRLLNGAEQVAQELGSIVSQGYSVVGAPDDLPYVGISDSLGPWDRFFLWRRMESGELVTDDGCGGIVSDSYELLAGGNAPASTLALVRAPIPSDMTSFATTPQADS